MSDVAAARQTAPLDESARREPVSRREMLAIAVLVVLGCALRCGEWNRLGVEHFDEGVYASNLWFDASAGQRYPMRHLYAPPLLPALVEWCLIFSGLAGRAAFVPSLLAGAALVPSIWWVGRRWFDPAAGLAAAALAATSDVHAVFSRMALTDSLLVLCLLWSIYGASETLRGGSDRSFLLAIGAATAAWWTKYNGWLTLAIPLAALPTWWLFSAPARRAWRRSLAWLAVIAIGTCLLWAPVVWFLQPFGGYAAVSANHAKYLTGWTGWPAAAARQLANLRQLESASLALLGPTAAVAAAMVVRYDRRGTLKSANDKRSAVRWLVGLLTVVGWACANVLVGSAVILAVLSTGLVACTAWSLRSRTNPATISACLLAVWCLGLTFATPLYHPYARLTLPWLVSTWLVVGWGVAAMCRQFAKNEGSPRSVEVDTLRFPAAARFLAWAPPLVAAATFFFLAPRPLSWTPVAWQSHATTRAAAREMVVRYGLADPAVGHLLLTYGEPALFFELRAAGALAVAPIGDLETAFAIAGRSDLQVSFVCGPHARHDEAVQRWLKSAESRKQIERFEFAPSTPVLLDRYSPEEVTADAPIVEAFQVVPIR